MVYVDNNRIPYRRMLMCHMVADSLGELHEMDDQIGIARRWFQGNANTPHYDICQSKRLLAVKHGAREVTARELVDVVRRLLLSYRRESRA